VVLGTHEADRAVEAALARRLDGTKARERGADDDQAARIRCHV
jgi:hypothetical protein